MESATEKLILKELREVKTELHDFRAENEKRWAENEKRWKENDIRWEQNDKELNKINKRIDESNERITALEEGRKKDRKDILLVLDTMQKSISNQFTEMREYMDGKFEKIFALQRVNDIEHEEFKKLLYSHNNRLDFHNARLAYLEEWKQQFDLGEYTAV